MLGVVASAILVLSDLILLYVPASASGYRFERLAPLLSSWRLVVGDFLGLAAIPLVLVALGHLYWGLRLAGRVTAAGPVFLFGVSYLLGAAFHHEVAAILQLARTPGHLSAAQFLIHASLAPLYAVFGGTAFVASLWLAGAILTGRTRYPRWAVMLSPVVTLPSLMLLARAAPPALAGGLLPASANLSVCIFFTLSVLALSRGLPRASRRGSASSA
jgi:hypothetical protein